ncbi:MMPL family transporter [Geodermatophilus sp. DF01_2]|uniref:MMPL family transporter n=1 Tax=Geodermatophilus sp. DF01-2 TaxID=2559610 RepID=UPI001FD7DC8D|nr:MMPL family transporter [Geodermatophilus sp. DF01_2]
MTGLPTLRWVVALPGRVARASARALRTAVVTGRWVVVAAWVAAAAFAVLVPAAGQGGGGGGSIGSLLPPDSEAVAVQQRSLEHFRVPVLSDTSVVVHNPDGLDALARADVALWALAHTQAYLEGEVPPGTGQIIGAVPLPFGSSETAVSYVYTSPRTGLEERVALGQQYAAHFRNQPGVETYVTGVLPAQVRQVHHLEAHLHTFEIATLILIAVVVAFAFRSVVAPLVVLFTAGLGYLVALRVLDSLAAALGFALPDQLQPLVAALLIGVVTDYCVLFFSGFRRELGRGLHRHEAARRTVLTEGPIVAVAGITVAAGTAALLVADFQLFQAFGPALALAVLVGMVVSLTLIPALMAILGHRLFLTIGTGRPASGEHAPSRLTRWLAGAVSRRGGAAVAVLFSLGLLIPASLPLTDLRIDVSFVSELPPDDPVRVGARVLAEAGVRGAVAPTEVLVEGDGVVAQRAALERFQAALEEQPGVAEVLGPADTPLQDGLGLVLAEDGDAARFVVVLDSDPLAAPAIADVGLLQERVDELLAASGVEDVTVGVGGQTAIAAELAEITRENLQSILIAALIIELLILCLYLRAVLAPLLLLACSALGVAAALGLAVLVFQGALDNPGLLFFAPFTTAVLLLALGSDYNVFAVGSIWEEAGRRPLGEAIRIAMPATAGAISAAGVILAATFAMVAIIPLGLFRQIAFVMAVGLLIDTFLIRPVLTPAVLTLLGRAAGWPSRRIRTSPQAPGDRNGTDDGEGGDVEPVESGPGGRDVAEAGRTR